MEKQKAREIMENFLLVPGHISKKILTAIINDQPIQEEVYCKFTSTKKIDNLRKRYQEKQKDITHADIKKSRYWRFYQILGEMYPGATIENLLLPRANNLLPSLLSLLLEKVDVDADSTLARKYSSLTITCKKTARILSKFMDQTNAIYPEQQEMQKILNWFFEGKNRDKGTIFIPICPDFAVEPTGDVNCPYRHTFEALGTGLGPVALRILDVLPLLKSMLDELNFSPTIIAGIADFEAFSMNNLKAFNLTEQEFLARVMKSKAEFEKKSNLTTLSISELAGGKYGWQKCLKSVKTKFLKNSFGTISINHNTLLEIAQKRKALYSRWYGEKFSLEEFVPFVLDQGAEYATAGIYIAEKLKNCLIIGADASVFAPFFSFSKAIPTLYLEKNYC